MAAAWLLTLLALAGIVAGAGVGQSRVLSARVAAIGGGLLFGIGVFWLIPELAERTGLPEAACLAIAVCGILSLFDHYLEHASFTASRIVWTPLLVAAALHSLLDGWSVRALAVKSLPGIAVVVGLALHKVPEGLALGWLTGRSMPSRTQGVLLCSLAELCTVAGAWLEMRADRSGVASFGLWWTALVLSVVAGSFLFFGFHTVVAERKKSGVIPAFLASLATAGLIAWARTPGV